MKNERVMVMAFLCRHHFPLWQLLFMPQVKRYTFHEIDAPRPWNFEPPSVAPSSKSMSSSLTR